MRSPIRPIDFHRRLTGYRPTALVELEPPPVPGVERMVIKLETARMGLPAFKVLGASWASAARVAAWLGMSGGGARDLEALRSALASRSDRPTLVTATDGNHGRAVAWTARALGIPAAIFVPSGTAAGRVDAIRGEGAAVTVVNGDYDDSVASAAAHAIGNRLLVQDTAVPGETAVDDIVEGYSTIFEELDGQLGPVRGRLVLVVPVGVGSLAVAAARYAAERSGATAIVTVEPAEAASLQRSLAEGRLVSLPGPHTSCMVGLRCGSISDSAWPELRSRVELAVAVDDDEADAAMRWLADRRIEVGECGAAALAAVRQTSSDGRLTGLVGEGPVAIALIATEAPTDPDRWERVVGRPVSPR